MLTVYDNANPSTKIVFTYSVSPATASVNIKSFTNIKSSFPNLYSMDGLDVNGIKIATILGLPSKATSTQTVDLSVGICDLPDPIECSEKEHNVRKDLEGLVKEILSTKPFNSNVNIYNLPSFTPLLDSYQASTIIATSSTYTSGTTASPNFDTLNIRYTTSPPNRYNECDFKLYHYRNNGTILNFSDIVNVTKLTGIGVPDLAGNYYSFKALATYVVGANPPVTDTIYGYSCWPIKNCNYCDNPILTTTLPSNTYSYSTAFNRITNTPYGSTNNGNFDPWWTVVQTQAVTTSTPYMPTGAITVFPAGTLAYDVAPYAGSQVIPGGGYISITSTSASTVPKVITFRTTFNLPNPLPSNKVYSLALNIRADDAIYRVSLNGTNMTLGSGGGAYGGGTFPMSFGVDTQTGVLLQAGVNTIEIDAADEGIIAYEMGAQVLIKVFEKLCDNGPPDSIFVFPPYTKYDNPCVRQKINLAYQNAANKYQQYINGIITTFANAYTQHCLSAFEKFTYKYFDKEYHHTLYYYDQAGNLIKTIPPEGVQRSYYGSAKSVHNTSYGYQVRL